MRKRVFWLAILLAGILLFSQAITASAVPPLPASFYGYVKNGGDNVPIGSSVTAWINGVQYAQYTVTAELYEGQTTYTLDVPGDDSATSGTIEGGVSGDTVVFKVNGAIAQPAGAWHSGTNTQIDLTVSTAPSFFIYVPVVYP